MGFFYGAVWHSHFKTAIWHALKYWKDFNFSVLNGDSCGCFWGNKKRKMVVQLWSANFDLSVCVCRLLGGSFCCKLQKKAICCSIENKNPVILDWSWKEAIDPLVRLCVQSCSVNSQLCVNEDGWCGHLSLKSRPGLILIPPSSPDYKVHRFGILKNKCAIDKIVNTSYNGMVEVKSWNIDSLLWGMITEWRWALSTKSTLRIQ